MDDDWPGVLAQRRRMSEQLEDQHLGEALPRQTIHESEEGLGQRVSLAVPELLLVDVEGHGKYPVGAEVPAARKADDVLHEGVFGLLHLLRGGLWVEAQVGQPLEEHDELRVALGVLSQEVVPRDRVSRLGLGLIVLLLEQRDLADGWRHGLVLQAQGQDGPRQDALLLQRRAEGLELLPHGPVRRGLSGSEANQPQHVRKEALQLLPRRNRRL
mmetsp:Transcript_93544/g.296812  ORF Transcript_93544/g.296812 Transcript_93544/m.296812 type:complete len:214 (+) Transcript_93544:440-1081(+)